MEIGIGLPAAIPGVTGATVAQWARRAQSADFSTVAVVDRIAYPNFEPLVTLAAAAAVTDTIRLTTSVILAPLRANTALLAKQLATIDQLSAGRLVVGLSVGSRADDFAVSEVEMRGRGRRLEAQVETVRGIWAGAAGTLDGPGAGGPGAGGPAAAGRGAGGPAAAGRGAGGPGAAGRGAVASPAVGPRPVRSPGPPIILGGHAPSVFVRAARCADGWIGGSGGPMAFRHGAQEVSAHWSTLGRPGRPRLLALAYFALGAAAGDAAGAYLRDYYGFAGPFVERVVAGAATSEPAVQAMAGQYAQAGCDELILMPCIADPAQVGLLRDALELTSAAR